MGRGQKFPHCLYKWNTPHIYGTQIWLTNYRRIFLSSALPQVVGIDFFFIGHDLGKCLYYTRPFLCEFDGGPHDSPRFFANYGHIISRFQFDNGRKRSYMKTGPVRSPFTNRRRLYVTCKKRVRYTWLQCGKSLMCISPYYKKTYSKIKQGVASLYPPDISSIQSRSLLAWHNHGARHSEIQGVSDITIGCLRVGHGIPRPRPFSSSFAPPSGSIYQFGGSTKSTHVQKIVIQFYYKYTYIFANIHRLDSEYSAAMCCI